LECEAFAESGLPILGLSINVPSRLLHRLVNQVAEHSSAHKHKISSPLGLVSETMNSALINAFIRLLQALHDDQEAAI